MSERDGEKESERKERGLHLGMQEKVERGSACAHARKQCACYPSKNETESALASFGCPLFLLPFFASILESEHGHPSCPIALSVALSTLVFAIVARFPCTPNIEVDN